MTAPQTRLRRQGRSTTCTARRALVAVLVGATTGAVFLGAGGRVAMLLFAVATMRQWGITFGGTMSVVLSGAIAGAIGGALLALTGRWLPQRRWLRGLAFAVLCYVVAIPGFRPPTPLVFGLFAPWFLFYGMATVWLTLRLSRSRAAAPTSLPRTPR
ncbi:MAG: hypothetical protein WD801_10815 [Gemmatimonadaceae bacterium]